MKRTMPAWKMAALHAGLAVLCVIALYPVLWVVKLALSPTQTLSMSANPLPTEITFDHFRDVLGSTDSQGRWLFGRQLLSSIVVSSATTIVGLSLAVTAAYALSRFRFPGKQSG
ncbi:MAG TPA: sugar ABC transporter permease, partial [Archangium sp.]